MRKTCRTLGVAANSAGAQQRSAPSAARPLAMRDTLGLRNGRSLQAGFAHLMSSHSDLLDEIGFEKRCAKDASARSSPLTCGATRLQRDSAAAAIGHRFSP